MPKNKGGRPTDYTQELADHICAELSSGRSMRNVCEDEGIPSRKTLFSWLRLYPEFLSQYGKAKEESADYLVEEMLDIADDGSNDWMERHDKEENCVGWQLNGEHVQRSRLRLDTRKWIASKLKAKKYGERITTEHTGNVGITDLTEDGLDERLRQLAREYEQSSKT